MTKTEFLQVLTSFANKMAAKIDSLFVRKETGKGLSTNDFTDELKAKVESAVTDNLTIDDALNADSTNPVQNKVIYTALEGKAASDHVHAFADLTETPTTLAGYGITDAEAAGAAAAAKTEANEYTNQKIADLIDSAPETMNTLKEVSDAIANNESTVEALNAAIGNKANTTDLTDHTGNSDIHITAEERTNWNDANAKKHEHANLDILNATTASFTTEEKEKLGNLNVMEEITEDDLTPIIDAAFAS